MASTCGNRRRRDHPYHSLGRSRVNMAATPSTRREEGKRTPSKTQRLREVVVGYWWRLRDGETFLFRQTRVMVADYSILQLLPHREIAPLIQRFLDI